MKIRNLLEKIISDKKDENWWKPDLFEIHTRNKIPKELKIIGKIPKESNNYNCFVFAFGLEKYKPILGWNGWDFQRQMDKNIVDLIKTGLLITKVVPQKGDIILYFTESGKISHVGKMKSGCNVISKWSWGPKIEHLIFQVPITYGNKVLFFKKPSNLVIKKLKHDLKEFMKSKT